MLSTSRLLRNSLRMRHILCRQVLLQPGDGGGAMQGREGLQGAGRRDRIEFTRARLYDRQGMTTIDHQSTSLYRREQRETYYLS